MLLNAVINNSKIDLNNRRYIDLENSSVRIYSIKQEKYVSIVFAVNKIDFTNFYNVSTDSGVLIEMNLIDGKVYTKDFIMHDKKNNIFKEKQKDFTEYKDYTQFFNNQKLSSIFTDINVLDYRKTVYSIMSKDFTSLVFLNYFRNLFEELSSYDIIEHIDDLDYNETLLSYFRRKGLCDNIFSLYISTLRPNYYNYLQTAFKRMYSKLLFDRKDPSVIEHRIHDYFRRKNEDLHSTKKLEIVKSLIPANCKTSFLVSRLDYIEQLYKFDEYLNNMNCLIRDKVLKFIKDFIGDESDNTSRTNKYQN